MKTCNKCGEEKPLSEYYEFHNHCKTCKHYWTEDARMRKAYGITLAEFDELLEMQGGCCAICGTDDPGAKRFACDHNHETGEVRGILCNNCNRMLGHGKDSVSILAAGIKYLAERGSYGES